MTIRGVGTREAIELDVAPSKRHARILIETDGEMVSITVDANHLEALEAACRATRLELGALAVDA